FSGCGLRCVFCQNHAISGGAKGRAVSARRLAEIFSALEEQGVHNLNLVTATHFTDAVITALKIAKLKIPVVWNSSGYERVETLRELEGLVQVYMPDFKYSSAEAARRYSSAPDYPEMARAAILEMFRQTGPYQLDGDGLMQSGLLIRHLILPGRLDDAFDVIDWVAESFPKNAVIFSLMSQFVPFADAGRFRELARRITSEEHARAKSYLSLSGIENAYYQSPSAATEELLPEFDLTGV
ncbi:MAG: radical SAM protein, partial [Bacillota bacterium]